MVILVNDRLSKWHSPGQGGCRDSAENGRTATGGRAHAMRLGVHVYRSVGSKKSGKRDYLIKNPDNSSVMTEEK